MVQTSSQRESIKNRLREIGTILWSPDAIDLERSARQSLKREERNLLLEYAENLEQVEASKCPICGETLRITMDLGGLHGPWWWKRSPVDFPADMACEHYRFYQGAINFGDRIPTEVTETVIAGPGAPFIIERVLGLPDVRAVVSQLQTELQDRIFLTTYFSPTALAPMQLHQFWLREKLPIPNEDGDVEFTEAFFDPWEFNLAPWFESKKLFWIQPDDATQTLSSSTPNFFSDVSGTLMRQVLGAGAIELREAPFGQKNTMYERP